MTSEIKAYIDQIAAKAQHLHTLLIAERERSAGLSAEISRLNGEVERQQSELDLLQQDIQALTSKLSEEREQTPQLQVNDLDVDALVKEIDFCIQQLKIANE